MPNETKFDAEDVELLTSIIEVIPNLTTIAYAVKQARQRLKFPIGKRSELLPFFTSKKTIQLGERIVTVAQLEQFLPEKFFPIESERDFICKLLIAFQIGDIYHNEELARTSKRDDTPFELLPGPTYELGGYRKPGRLKLKRRKDRNAIIYP